MFFDIYRFLPTISEISASFASSFERKPDTTSLLYYNK
jgi:hypothetical protein